MDQLFELGGLEPNQQIVGNLPRDVVCRAAQINAQQFDDILAAGSEHVSGLAPSWLEEWKPVLKFFRREPRQWFVTQRRIAENSVFRRQRLRPQGKRS